jgi:thiol-disulfide isomerase/thioredoxin
MTRRFPLAVAAVLCFAGLAAAQNTAPAAKPDTAPKADAPKAEKVLMVGDKAPALTVKEFVKGEPITGFEKGKVYIVEFWATWCGPCIASMPHLTEIQSEYKGKGLTIVGVTSEDKRNTLEAVKQMVKDKGDGMGYTVAWDDSRKTNEAYMKAAQQPGIPCSFVVNQDGVIAYIGHPSGLDKPLAEIMSGKYDIKAATAKYAKDRENEPKLKALYQQFGQAIQAKDKAAAQKALDEVNALNPDLKAQTSMTWFQVLLEQFNDTDAAYAVAKENIGGAWKDDAQALNAVAWTIVDPEGTVQKKDLALAEQAAKRAAELTKNKDGAILDTVARVHFCKGEIDKAIEVQTTAVSLASAEMKPQLQTALDEYKAAKAGKK